MVALQPCPNCDSMISPRAVACPKCGEPEPFKSFKCVVCGFLLDRSATVCSECGEPEPFVPKPEPFVPEHDDITIKLNPNNPDDLIHTRILRGHFGKNGNRDSVRDSVRNWRELVYIAHRYALEYFKNNFNELERASLSNICKGRRTDCGYKAYHIGISIQSHDANHSWQNALHLAKQIMADIDLLVEWRQKEGATYPGRKGSLIWNSSDYIRSKNR